MMNYINKTRLICLKKYRNSICKCYISYHNCLYFQEYRNCTLSVKQDMYKTDLKLNNTCLDSYIKKIEKEYIEICKDKNYSANLRWMELHPIVQILRKRQSLVENIYNLKELLNEPDPELKKLAEDEKQQFEIKIKETDEELVEALLPINVEPCDDIVLEVQAGVGGQEAMLFAKEIFNMYCNFAKYKGWELQIADFLSTDMGGVRHAAALIKGQDVFQYFRYEAGIHRVQRTPVTEKTGRIHTSTISVTALPQPTEIQVNINSKDLKIETKRSTGAGGQHVNTTDSAVRIVHLPTGLSVECQVDRSQIKNRKMAMARLTALLYQKELDNQIAETQATRKNQVRTMNRNEKIRTYNFNQDRITDHRLSSANIHNLEVFLQGGEALDQLIQRLERQDRIDNLLNIINDNK